MCRIGPVTSDALMLSRVRQGGSQQPQYSRSAALPGGLCGPLCGPAALRAERASVALAHTNPFGASYTVFARWEPKFAKKGQVSEHDDTKGPRRYPSNCALELATKTPLLARLGRLYKPKYSSSYSRLALYIFTEDFQPLISTI